MHIKFSFFKKYNIIGKNNRIMIGNRQLKGYHRIDGLDVSINGSNNLIVITDNTVFKGSKIIIDAANNVDLMFAESPEINNLSVFVRNGHGQKLSWGKNTTIVGGYIELCETNASVIIGKECMLGWHISIVATDFHAVLDKDSKTILNLPGDVVIGDNCWLGHGVRLLKNAKIPNHTIVGAESVITKKFTEKWTAIGGNPSKIIKRNVDWNRKSPTDLQNSKKS